jgi:hypothetical protein
MTDAKISSDSNELQRSIIGTVRHVLSKIIINKNRKAIKTTKPVHKIIRISIGINQNSIFVFIVLL